MVASVLFVCTGNICRSPVAEFALRDAMPDLTVASAGLHALVGHDVDKDSAEAARTFGITVTKHSAQKFTEAIGQTADLVIVMGRDHREEIGARWPHLTGKTMMLGHFENGKEIPDPYRMGRAMHLRAVEMICESMALWQTQLKAMR